MGLYAIRSKDQISIGNCRWKCGSCPRLNRVVEFECVCCAEIDCVVAKNNEAVGAKGLAELPILDNTASRVPRRLFESLGSLDGMVPV